MSENKLSIVRLPVGRDFVKKKSMETNEPTCMKFLVCWISLLIASCFLIRVVSLLVSWLCLLLTLLSVILLVDWLFDFCSGVAWNALCYQMFSLLINLVALDRWWMINHALLPHVLNRVAFALSVEACDCVVVRRVQNRQNCAPYDKCVPSCDG